jgi:hypothetical protein
MIPASTKGFVLAANMDTTSIICGLLLTISIPMMTSPPDGIAALKDYAIKKCVFAAFTVGCKDSSSKA